MNLNEYISLAYEGPRRGREGQVGGSMPRAAGQGSSKKKKKYKSRSELKEWAIATAIAAGITGASLGASVLLNKRVKADPSWAEFEADLARRTAGRRAQWAADDAAREARRAEEWARRTASDWHDRPRAGGQRAYGHSRPGENPFEDLFRRYGSATPPPPHTPEPRVRPQWSNPKPSPGDFESADDMFEHWNKIKDAIDAGATQAHVSRNPYIQRVVDRLKNLASRVESGSLKNKARVNQEIEWWTNPDYRDGFIKAAKKKGYVPPETDSDAFQPIVDWFNEAVAKTSSKIREGTGFTVKQPPAGSGKMPAVVSKKKEVLGRMYEILSKTQERDEARLAKLWKDRSEATTQAEFMRVSEEIRKIQSRLTVIGRKMRERGYRKNPW